MKFPFVILKRSKYERMQEIIKSDIRIMAEKDRKIKEMEKAVQLYKADKWFNDCKPEIRELLEKIGK